MKVFKFTNIENGNWYSIQAKNVNEAAIYLSDELVSDSFLNIVENYQCDEIPEIEWDNYTTVFTDPDTEEEFTETYRNLVYKEYRAAELISTNDFTIID